MGFLDNQLNDGALDQIADFASAAGQSMIAAHGTPVTSGALPGFGQNLRQMAERSRIKKQAQKALQNRSAAVSILRTKHPELAQWVEAGALDYKKAMEHALVAPAQRMPLEISGQLVDPNTYEVEGDYWTPDKATSTIQNFEYGLENPEFVDDPENLNRTGAPDVNEGGVTMPTEGHEKYVGRANRMAGASETLSAIEQSGYDPANWRDGFGREAGVAGNIAMTNEGRQYVTAARDWISGVLRLDASAAVPEEEFWWFFKTYFPQPGDDPTTIKQKTAQREVVEQSIRKASGGIVDAMGVPSIGGEDQPDDSAVDFNDYFPR